MYSRLIFQRTVYIISCHRTDDFFETAGCALIGAGYIQFPAFCFAVLGVHAEKVSGKNSCFVTACTTADFKNSIAAVLRVGRDKQQFDLLFQFRLARLAGVEFFASHFSHFGIGFVGDDFFGFLNAA